METTFIDKSIPEEVLEHYGVPKRSGRYPWGSGENPYHHGASSPFGRLKARRNAKKLAKKRKAAAARARETRAANKARQQDAETYEERKRAALAKGSATDIAPFVKDMTAQELKQARERLEEQEKFMKLVVKETPQAQRAAKAQKVMDTVKTATLNANTAIGAYNTFARAHNAFSDRELPIIQSGGRTRREIRTDLIKDADEAAKKAKALKEEKAAKKQEKRDRRAEARKAVEEFRQLENPPATTQENKKKKK